MSTYQNSGTSTQWKVADAWWDNFKLWVPSDILLHQNQKVLQRKGKIFYLIILSLLLLLLLKHCENVTLFELTSVSSNLKPWLQQCLPEAVNRKLEVVRECRKILCWPFQSQAVKRLSALEPPTVVLHAGEKETAVINSISVASYSNTLYILKTQWVKIIHICLLFVFLFV